MDQEGLTQPHNEIETIQQIFLCCDSWKTPRTYRGPLSLPLHCSDLQYLQSTRVPFGTFSLLDVTPPVSI